MSTWGYIRVSSKDQNEDRDWGQFHSPANLAKSIAIEASELLECFQWDEENYELEDVKNDKPDGERSQKISAHQHNHNLKNLCPNY